jgi:hypothetical protein
VAHDKGAILTDSSSQTKDLDEGVTEKNRLFGMLLFVVTCIQGFFKDS